MTPTLQFWQDTLPLVLENGRQSVVKAHSNTDVDIFVEQVRALWNLEETCYLLVGPIADSQISIIRQSAIDGATWTLTKCGLSPRASTLGLVILMQLEPISKVAGLPNSGEDQKNTT